jgi:tripartite-type tricarboxylate transporter receptor subunit TctC
MHRWSPCLAIILVASAALTPGAADAQSAFKGPLKILVGFAAGGSSDIAARMLADKLKDTLGQPVVVENRVGAGGRIAAEALKNAPPDGATLLLTPVVVPVLAPLVFKELNYDPAKDFAPVSQVATYQFAFAVAPNNPAKTVPEFVAWLKANALSDMMELHRAGKIRIIATSGAQRSPLLPTVATFKEQGFASIEGSGWIGVYVPSKTPKPVIDQLSASIVKALQMPEVRERFLSLGYEPTGTTPEALAAIMAADTARWGPIIKRSGFSE